ncbi:MAG: hypothetical protein IAC23_06675 [Bacteroidetes bacterium]|uniref:Uncharacterized protein n=1 Tax=Candidatus Cryptobacteroides merdavium TaxID=2840769 RepID=A0A9D9EE79_9BACT|nr:hypothetical protein [Candidatus Cryptobacteroides merdavium]
MKNIKIIIGIAAVSAILLPSCSGWTEPEALDYGGNGDVVQKSDEYLSALRAFKQTEHKIMILRMEGTDQQPFSRNQHISAMPDSADYICVDIVSGSLHSEIAAEIPQVRQQKGTRCLNYVDFAVISEEWTALEDGRPDGEPAGTADEFAAFCAERTETMLSLCDEYGFDGIMFSFQGSIQDEMTAAGQTAFLSAIKSWRQAYPDALLFARGSLANIVDEHTDILFDCDYTVLVSSTQASLSQLNLLARTFVRNDDVPSDRIAVEVAVPSEEDPEPACATPQTAAQWVVEPEEDYVKLGVCVGNAEDDYLVDGTFRNIRAAINILNAAENQTEE